MGFHHRSMLIALCAMLVPIILHLLNRRSAKLVDWGAMQFLLGSLVSRRRRLLIEEMMLLAMRCLLFALAALALAQPFVYADSQTPWALVLPALLFGAVALGVGTAFWSERVWRWRLWGTGCLLLLLAAGLVALEGKLHLVKKLGSDRDVALILDDSSSMNLKSDGQTNFQRAVAESREVVQALGKTSNLAVILAGPAPKVVTPRFLTQRDEMDATLKDLKPLGGSSALRAAVQAAWLKLQDSPHSAKQIIVYTDQQKDGWDFDDVARWQETATMLKSEGAPPQILVRALALPKTVRNVTVSQLALSRSVIGTDAPVTVNVQVKNTGTEPLSAAKVRLLLDGKQVDDRLYGRLNPGESATVSFSYHFEKPGAKILEARVTAEDDLADDNVRLLAVRVLDRLPVLLVNGNPSAEFRQQATAFVQAALQPDVDESSSGTRGAAYRPLVVATVEDAAAVSRLKDFGDYRVIVLSDVARLSPGAARRLAEFVAQGGGLIVAPGARALPDFYNNWKRRDGRGPLMPALLETRRTLAADEKPVHLALSTFVHPALSPLSDAKKTDLTTALFRSFWKLGAEGSSPLASGGNFTSGEPLLVEQRVGSGSVILLATSLDVAGSNLARCKSFVVLVHSLVYHLADAGSGGLTFEAGPDATLALRAETSHAVAFRRWQPGLQGDYYSGGDFEELPVLQRIDPQIDFNWAASAPGAGVDAQKFAVRWTGALLPPKSETYQLILTGQGAARLWIDGKQVITRNGGGAALANVPMRAGSPYELLVEEIKTGGQASAKLEWENPSQPRQAVPPSALVYAVESAKGKGDDDAFVITSPDGQQEKVQGEVRGGVLSLKMPAAVAPGVYHVRPPEAMQGILASAVDDKQTVPVTMTTSAREFNLAALKDDDFKSLKPFVVLENPAGPKELLLLAGGESPQQEIWKYLALAALVLLIAEVAVTRWIALQRRVTTDTLGEFTLRGQANAAMSLQRFLPNKDRQSKAGDTAGRAGAVPRVPAAPLRTPKKAAAP